MVDAEVRQHLIDLNHSEVQIRKAAAAAFSRRHRRFPLEKISSMLSNETDGDTRSWLLLGLGLARYRPALNAVHRLTRDDLPIGDPDHWATIAVNFMTNTDSAAQAISKLKSSDQEAAYRGVTEGFHIRDKSAEHIQLLRRLVDNGSEAVRRWALMGLARTNSPLLASDFAAHMQTDHDPTIREWSAWAIGLNKLQGCSTTLRRSLSAESNPRVREWIIKATHQIDPGLSTAASWIDLYKEEEDALIKEGIAECLLASGPFDSIALFRSEFQRLSETVDDWSKYDRRLFSQIIKLFYHVSLSEDDRSCCRRLLENQQLDGYTKALLVNLVFCDVQSDDELTRVRKMASGKDMLLEYILDSLPLISEGVVRLGKEMERLMPTWRQNEYVQVGKEGITYQTVIVEANGAKMFSATQIALGSAIANVQQTVEATHIHSVEQTVIDTSIEGNLTQVVGKKE